MKRSAKRSKLFLRSAAVRILFCIVLLPVQSYSQNGLFLYCTLDCATPSRVLFDGQGSVLQKSWKVAPDKDLTDACGNAELNLLYRFQSRFGISLSLNLGEKYRSFHDARFMSENGVKGCSFSSFFTAGADSGNFYPERYYATPNISFSYAFYHNPVLGYDIYLNAGAGINLLAGLRENILDDYSFYYGPAHEKIRLDVNWKQRFPSVFFEIGWRGFTRDWGKENPHPGRTTKGMCGGFGIRYSYGGNYMHADYRVYRNGVLQYTDRVTLCDSYFGVFVTCGGSIFGNKIDWRRERMHEQQLAKIADAKRQYEEKIRELHSREFSVKQEIVVHGPVITVSVLDDMKYDHDIITLELNGKILLENYTLKPSKKELQLTLDGETNSLVLHAISEGKEKPCTVALLIDDGHTQQKVILNSTMSQSEVLSIRVIK